jgi:aldose 1-epimerase
MSITKALFGKVPDTKKEVYIFTLTNKNGLSIQILSLGGIVYTLNVPDKHDTIKNISANLPAVEEYLTISHFLLQLFYALIIAFQMENSQLMKRHLIFHLN